MPINQQLYVVNDQSILIDIVLNSTVDAVDWSAYQPVD